MQQNRAVFFITLAIVIILFSLFLWQTFLGGEVNVLQDDQMKTEGMTSA